MTRSCMFRIYYSMLLLLFSDTHVAARPLLRFRFRSCSLFYLSLHYLALQNTGPH